MNKNKIKEKIEKLRKELSILNHNYYNLINYKTSDYFFDKKLKELEKLEKKFPIFYDSNSPTINIGSKVKKNNEIKYRYKMYSLKNTYSKKDLFSWEKTIKKSIKNHSFISEIKYDGVSINLIYKNGILIHGITRGNGIKGENVTKHIKIVPSIPHILQGNNYPSYLEIRGEIFLHKNNFMEINKNRDKQGLPIYLNPRNAVSGFLKTKSNGNNKKQNIYQTKKLCFVAFQVEGKKFKTQNEMLKIIKKWGFNSSKKICTFKKIEEFFYFIDLWEKEKNNLSYNADGLVIKLNNINHQLKLGYTSKYPKWAVSYKFKPKKSETKLIDMIFQVGRTGIITPIAKIHPTFISGTVIKKINFYNNNFIHNKKIHYNDTIFLEKGGDIIPKMTKVNVSKRLKHAIPIYFLKKCPSCFNILKKKNNLLYCVNEKCFSRKIMQLKHFTNENAMDIKNIGIKIIEKLYRNKKVIDCHDFFRLKEKDLLEIDGIRKKLAKNILINIEKSKKKPYHKVLYSLGIHHIGENTAKILEENFTDINLLMKANFNEITSIPGIGEKIAKSIINFFSIYNNKHIINMLIYYGLNLSKNLIENRKNINPKIKGKHFLFTGRLSSMTRKKAKNIIEYFGGKSLNNINKYVDYIIVGEKPGMKLKKILKKKKNIIILNENKFIKIIKKN